MRNEEGVGGRSVVTASGIDSIPSKQLARHSADVALCVATAATTFPQYDSLPRAPDT
jgi:hypothetical protein